MNRFRILIADDHALIRSGLRSLLSREPEFEIVAEARDGKEAVELAEREHPHIAIVDIGMPTLKLESKPPGRFPKSFPRFRSSCSPFIPTNGT